MSDMNISNANTSPATADRFVWTVCAAQADGSIDGLQDRVIWDAAHKKLSIEYAKPDGTFQPAQNLTYADESGGQYAKIVPYRLQVDLDENGKADAHGKYPFHEGDLGNCVISTTQGTHNWALSSFPDSYQGTAGTHRAVNNELGNFVRDKIFAEKHLNCPNFTPHASGHTRDTHEQTYGTDCQGKIILRRNCYDGENIPNNVEVDLNLDGVSDFIKNHDMGLYKYWNGPKNTFGWPIYETRNDVREYNNEFFISSKIE